MVRSFRHIPVGLLTVIFIVLLIVGPTIYAKVATSPARYDANIISLISVPKHDVAIIFGAGVLPNGQPTEYLRNRIITGVTLYKEGRVRKILMSGDNRTSHYNEPAAMARYAQMLGVPRKDIVEDYAGYNTYATCYRASVIFAISSATVITQGYHLPRAVMTCNHLGITTIGVAAKRQGRDSALMYIAREFISTDKAVIELMVKPVPAVLGGPEPIF